ncbi:MAG TPA: hypothetical protein VFG69_21795 [Nannocystaceae bacterium]|nr:hypothetical protein [Nannocystaceae bacterium]
MTRTTHSLLSLAFLLSTTIGCDKTTDSSASSDKKDTKSADSKDAKAAAPTEKDPKELFTSKLPELPGPLAKLTFGMTTEEVKKAAPELEDGYARAKEFKDTYFGYYVPDSGKKQLASVRVALDGEGADLEKVLVAAWGEPKRGTELDKPKLYWFNPEKKIRATVHQGYGKENEVQFEPYLPAKELLGEGKEKLGFETTPLLGATYDVLKKDYAQWLEVMTKEEAEKQREKIEKMTGQKLDILGDAVASTNIDLPTTEFGSSFTRVNPTMENGKIVRFRVGIDYDPFPPAKDEIFALLKAKWGEPKEQEKYGRKQFLFNAANPTVVVEDDDISKKWDIEVSQ